VFDKARACEKMFRCQAKTNFFVTSGCQNKLECVSLASIFLANLMC
jgi:hypothetical protein